MKKSIIHPVSKVGFSICLLILAAQLVRGQTANLLIQEPNGASIIVYLDGVKQNYSAQPQLHLTDLPPGTCEVKVTCRGATIVQESVTLSPNTESVYEITKKREITSISHFLKRTSVFPISAVAQDDRGTTSANYTSLASTIRSVKSALFFADGFSTKDAWEARILSQAREMKYYDCLAEQIKTIVSVKSDVFFADGPSTKAEWAKRMVETIMANPKYDCSIPEKIRAIVNGKDRSGAFGPSEKANWAKREIEKLFY